MRKRNSQTAAVLTICLMFLGPLASGLLAADTGTTQTIDPTLALRAPSQFLIALFPFLLDFLSNNNATQTQTSTDQTILTARPTGTIKSVRLSGGD
jgi:hypothetical protein